MSAFPGAAIEYDQTTTSTWSVTIETEQACKELLLLASVARDTLTIEIDEPKEVWPEILTDHYPGSNTEFNQSEVDNTIGVFIKMQAASAPVVGQQVTVIAEWVEESGGHYHGSHAELTCANTGTKGSPTGSFRLKLEDLSNPGTLVAELQIR